MADTDRMFTIMTVIRTTGSPQPRIVALPEADLPDPLPQGSRIVGSPADGWVYVLMTPEG